MLDALAPIQAAVWLFFAALVLWFGGRTERLATGVLLLGWLVTLSAYVDVDQLSRAAVSPIILVCDSLQLMVFVVLAYRSGRAWMTWASAFFAIVVLVQIVSMLDVRILNVGYVAVQTAASFGIMACLVFGAFRSRYLWQREGLGAVEG
ncbi:hypothetical protein [Brevundimonas aveniformis]|uniref:hypothetical protein n=1 Tax=Brevundimonas aveniformis TaxID=370977 RepID=UPI00040C383B|nr:hypothetical protein [Brevundimonas aveniformis]